MSQPAAASASSASTANACPPVALFEDVIAKVLECLAQPAGGYALLSCDDAWDQQEALSQCMRVSKLFNKYAGPPLYRRPYIFNLQHFFDEALATVPDRSRRPKSELLRGVRAMRLGVPVDYTYELDVAVAQTLTVLSEAQPAVLFHELPPLVSADHAAPVCDNYELDRITPRDNLADDPRYLFPDVDVVMIDGPVAAASHGIKWYHTVQFLAEHAPQASWCWRGVSTFPWEAVHFDVRKQRTFTVHAGSLDIRLTLNGLDKQPANVDMAAKASGAQGAPFGSPAMVPARPQSCADDMGKVAYSTDLATGRWREGRHLPDTARDVVCTLLQGAVQYRPANAQITRIELGNFYGRVPPAQVLDSLEREGMQAHLDDSPVSTWARSLQPGDADDDAAMLLCNYDDLMRPLEQDAHADICQALDAEIQYLLARYPDEDEDDMDDLDADDDDDESAVRPWKGEMVVHMGEDSVMEACSCGCGPYTADWREVDVLEAMLMMRRDEAALP